MKVLMVHPHDIYHNLEPWTVRITYLANELVAAGHEVKLIYHLREPDVTTAEAGRIQKYPYETIPYYRHESSMLNRIRFLQRWAYWADIVHFQKCSHYSAIPAVCAAIYHRKPVHYDWDDWEQKIYEQNEHYSKIGSWIYFQQMERHLLRLVDTVSVASQALQALTIRYHFPQDCVFHIPVGADVQTFSPEIDGQAIKDEYQLNGTTILYQGQISGANYVHLFLRAAQLLLRGRKDLRFIVVGGGDRLHHAKQLAEQLNIMDHTKFIGPVSHEQVPRFVAAADIAVACFEDNAQSRCKSPLKLAEYMASGKAIVANKVGDVPFMLADCGMTVENDSAEAIAGAVKRLVEDPDLRRELGEKARQRSLQKINWHNSAQTLAQAYHHALFTRYAQHDNC